MSIRALALTAACALALAASAANADTYDFSTLPQGTTVTPLTLNGATFTASNDPGGFTVGPNAGLFSTLGSSVLSSGGVAATLNIAFSTAQLGISFDVGMGDFLAANGSDAVTVNTYNGTSLVSSQALTPVIPTASGDFYPQGFFSLVTGGPFTSVTISAADGAGAESFAIAELATATVPLPATLWMLLSGLGGGLAFARRCGATTRPHSARA
jgi:hypothetical protein